MDEMWADYFTKPLQGAKFLEIRRVIMNEPGGRSVLESGSYDDESSQIKEHSVHSLNGLSNSADTNLTL